jgi:hypothetical protein
LLGINDPNNVAKIRIEVFGGTSFSYHISKVEYTKATRGGIKLNASNTNGRIKNH